MDIANLVATSASVCIHNFFGKERKDCKRKCTSLAWFLYCSAFAAVIGHFIIAGWSKSFIDFIELRETSKSNDKVFSTFLDSSNTSLKWNTVKKGITKDSNKKITFYYFHVTFLVDLATTACPYKDDLGDSFCDERANIASCEYDGGDCCSSKKDARPNIHQFCQNCSCLNKDLDESQRMKLGVFYL